MVEEINNLSETMPIFTYYQQESVSQGMDTHFHCYHELILIRDGGANIQIDGTEYYAGANDLVVMCDLQLHKIGFPACFDTAFIPWSFETE